MVLLGFGVSIRSRSCAKRYLNGDEITRTSRQTEVFAKVGWYLVGPLLAKLWGGDPKVSHLATGEFLA